MRRTSPLTLVAAGVVGLVIGLVLEFGLAAAGQGIVMPPATIGIAATAIGAVLIALAVPVRRTLRGGRRVDPFYATRVVVLAKASSITGVLLAGFGAGVLVYLLTRPSSPTLESVLLTAATIVGSVALLVMALIAENMCALPPDDRGDGDPRGGASGAL